ncbi:hypothetical protein OA501_02535 [Flavobacteriaceae bacterium]|nr:hypothetical protein [Flavobacteriaceae bacterium]
MEWILLKWDSKSSFGTFNSKVSIEACALISAESIVWVDHYPSPYL